MREWSINDGWLIYHRRRQKPAKVSAVGLSHVWESLAPSVPKKYQSHVFRIKFSNKSISITNQFLGFSHLVFQKSAAPTAFWTYIQTGYNIHTSLHALTIHCNYIHNDTPCIVRIQIHISKNQPGPPEAPPIAIVTLQSINI